MKTRATIIGLSPLKHARIPKAVAATCKLLLLICAATMTQAQTPTNFVTGALWRETWFNIPGSQVRDLLSDWRFPNSPDQAAPVASFETSSNVADDYGVRWSGYLSVPVSGIYIFYINADQTGVLMLSTNENPAKKQIIAIEPSYNETPRQWINSANQSWRGNPPANISDPIGLVAGRWYYVEALMKEACCADNLAVTWRIPGGNAVTNGAPPIPGTYLACWTLPFGQTLVSAQTCGNPNTVTPGFARAYKDLACDSASLSRPRAYFNCQKSEWR